MLRKNSNQAEISITMKDAKAENSNIGCIITNQVNFLDISIKNLFDDILQEIKEIEDEGVKEKLEVSYYNIYQLYINNNEEFLWLAKISSCSLGEDPKSIQMQNIIKFWIIAKYCNEDIDMTLVAKLSGKFEFSGSNVWFFSPSNSTTRSIEKCIVKIKHFLKITKMDSLKNGKCYISKITPTKDFNCDKCKDGYIEIGNTNEIIEDFVDGKKTVINFNDKILQSDFINIQIERNLKMKCGNCVSDLEEVPRNIGQLVK